MPSVLVDAGPLVALIDRSDQHHQHCVDTLATIRDPLCTVWPALTEAMYLVRVSAHAQRALWDTINIIGVRLLDMGLEDCPRMRELMWKYRNLPMDLADAALVRVAERDNLRRIFTMDRQDFENLCASNSVTYDCFFLRSAQRRFIASDNRLLPSGVRPPRLRFFVVDDPLGLPTRFLPAPPDKADPNSAEIARPSLSLSFVKSATNLLRSKG